MSMISVGSYHINNCLHNPPATYPVASVLHAAPMLPGGVSSWGLMAGSRPLMINNRSSFPNAFMDQSIQRFTGKDWFSSDIVRVLTTPNKEKCNKREVTVSQGRKGIVILKDDT